MELTRKTSLETQEEIKDTLNWKLEQLKTKNLPVESGMADYVAFGVQNIDQDVEQLENYVKQLQEAIKAKKAHKTKVLEDVAEWLQEQGLDKLNGVMCSSITIAKAKEAKEEKKVFEVFEHDLTQEEIEQAILESGNGEYIKKETTKITPATKAKIKVNSRRK